MSNPVFAFLDGKEYVLDGIHGTFKHDLYEAKYPYVHTVEKLSHNPSKQGMLTKEYAEIKNKLRDDWSTDLTDSLERYCEIATELGYNESDTYTDVIGYEHCKYCDRQGDALSPIKHWRECPQFKQKG